MTQINLELKVSIEVITIQSALQRQITPEKKSTFTRSSKGQKIRKNKISGKYMKEGSSPTSTSCSKSKSLTTLSPTLTWNLMILPIDPKSLKLMWGQVTTEPWSRVYSREGFGGPLLRKRLRIAILSGLKSRSMISLTNSSKTLCKKLVMSTVLLIHRFKLQRRGTSLRKEKP